MLNSIKVNLTCNVPQHLRDDLVALVGSQNAFHDCQDIVRRPGEYEDQQDGRQSLGRLPLLPLLLGRLLQFVLPWQGGGGGGGCVGLADALDIPHNRNNNKSAANSRISRAIAFITFLEINQHFSPDYLYNSQPNFNRLMLVLRRNKKFMLSLLHTLRNSLIITKLPQY